MPTYAAGARAERSGSRQSGASIALTCARPRRGWVLLSRLYLGDLYLGDLYLGYISAELAPRIDCVRLSAHAAGATRCVISPRKIE